jgi:dolichyl-phosphooligosaccharide-protein glycotransferase
VSRAPDTAAPERRGVRTGVWLGVILLAGLLLRGLPLTQVFVAGGIAPGDPDSVYHLWRIEETVRHGTPPRFDRFLNAPSGAEVPYPDGFDALVGWTARVLFGPLATRHQVQVVALTVVPLLGLLSILAVFWLGRVVSGSRGPALLAAALAAVLPVHLWTSSLGHVDHHAFEILLPAAAASLLLGGTGRRRLARAAAAGLAMALLGYLITSALLHLGLVALAVAAAALAASWRGEPAMARRLLADAAVAGLVCSALLLPDALSRQGYAPFAASRLPLIICLLGSAVAAGSLLAVRHGFRALLVALVLPVAALGVGLRLLLPQGFEFVLRRNLIALISESLPIWKEPWSALQLHSAALVVLPLCFAELARRRRSLAASGVAAMGLTSLGLACLQLRFGMALAAPAAVALAVVASAVWSRRGWLRRGLLLLGGAAALVPSLLAIAQTRVVAPQAVALGEASDWLARHSPPAGERRAREPSPYAVLTQFADGNYVAYYGSRPAVAGAFAYGDHARGLEDSLQILFASRDPRPLLAARRVRYVLLTGTASHVLREALGLGQPGGRPYLYTQLFDHDGGVVMADSPGGPRIYPAVGDLRLVHESPLRLPRGRGTSSVVKVFERVAGARLQGACQGRMVRAKISLTTDQGRALDYLGAADCRAGRFALAWPHAGTALLQQLPSGQTWTVQVAERDVVDGRTVEAGHGAAAPARQ